ncbi:DUF2332 domain-containing protein [Streptacidiphilus fuscans]|uniref:DUF2332 domain-containing protein n=1 Tax=Streptacidiphilus fuscans TaxID=2789292 RepID=UPI002E280362|nr:DUF2332 domain-containing protein [Streptacidiphilus fuscans]
MSEASGEVAGGATARPEAGGVAEVRPPGGAFVAETTPDAASGVERTALLFERQALGCEELGSPFYAGLLRRAAEDVRAGGPCADAVAGYEQAPGPDAIALRLLGGVHALVLTGRAPRLAPYYPSAGGTADASRSDACWREFRQVVADELPWIRDWMTRPPQTNEVGRANLLIAALLRASVDHPLPIRLFELGSSAGLNLRPELFRYSAPGYTWGSPDSPVHLDDAWQGGVPTWLAEAAESHPTLDVVERHGCDLTPIDPLTESGALALRAYVWADQPARSARLRGALELAARHPAQVQRLGAAEFLKGVHVQDGTLTVVWHSIMKQYVPAQEWAEVSAELARLAGESSAEAPFAYVSFEPERVGNSFPFRASVRIGTRDRILLAEAYPHGLPAWAM